KYRAELRPDKEESNESFFQTESDHRHGVTEDRFEDTANGLMYMLDTITMFREADIEATLEESLCKSDSTKSTTGGSSSGQDSGEATSSSSSTTRRGRTKRAKAPTPRG